MPASWRKRAWLARWMILLTLAASSSAWLARACAAS
jgi:hypothetical protein